MPRANPNVQIASSRSSSNAICQRWLAKHNQNRKTTLENKYLSRHLDAAIPLRSAKTELQSTIAQRQQRRDKATWNPHRAGFDGKATTPETIAHASQLFYTTEHPFTRKRHYVSFNLNIQNISWMSQFQCDLPTMSCKTQSESDIKYWRTSTLREALTQLFHCDLHRLSCKTQYPTLLCLTLLCSILLLYSSLLFSTLRSFALLYFNSTPMLLLLYFCLYSTSTRPLRRCQLDTMIF